MKLELSLPERPNLLHALPLCDLLLMLWILFVLGSTMLRQAGVAVELPASQFQLERYQETHVITLVPGEGGPRYYLGRDAVDLVGLRGRLQQLHDEGAPARSVILLRADQAVSFGAARQVEEMVLGLGFRVALLGSEQVPDVQPEPAAD